MAAEGKTASPPSLEDAIEKAGSPIKLLWKYKPAPWKVPVVQPEFVGWSEEQGAWAKSVALSDLSHHMFDLFIEGPDATRLLKYVGANDFENFAVGQAKQFVPVTEHGHIVTDGILMRDGPEKYTLSGVPASQTWVRYHGETGKYDVKFAADPDSEFRRQGNPVLFRYQLQGPLALEVTERMFGAPLPKTKFFHSTPVSLQGRNFRAFRHGMAGQAGYEFIGEWKDAAFVKDAILKTGEPYGLIQVGGLAYSTNGVESGWIPTPTLGIYTDPKLKEYRRSISLVSYEGQKPLSGSYFSENIEDYYTSPYELGYAKSIAFNHDFIGRQALERAAHQVQRTKVTLVLNPEDVQRIFGADPKFLLSYGRYRIDAGQRMVGMTFYTAYIGPLGTVLALSLIDKEFSAPGTQVTLLWGEHPGPGTAPEADLEFPRIRATVQPSPYNEHARKLYRRNN